MTTRDLLTRALRTIGFVGEDQPLKDPVANDALLILQDLIDSWNTDRRVVFTTNRLVLALQAGVPAYPIGAAAAAPFDVTRPQWIDQAAVIRSTDPTPFEYPVDLLEESEWNDIPMKGLSSSLVTRVFYEPAFPLGTINVWMVPTDGTLSLVLYVPQLLSEPVDLDTVLTLAPGYRRGFRCCLAVELHPEFGRGRPLNPVLAKQAADSLRAIQDRNLDPGLLVPDRGIAGPGLDGGVYSIFTNRYKPR